MARHPIENSVVEIEEALAQALNRGSFEVVTDEGHRHLQPVLGYGFDEMDHRVVPRLDLSQVSRDVERYLS